MAGQHLRDGNGTNGSSDVDNERTPLIAGPQVDGAEGSITNEEPPSYTSLNPSTDPPISQARIAVCCAAIGVLILLQTMNITMMTTTQSVIARDLDAFEVTSWFSSAYLIAVAAFGPLHGKFNSIFSPRKCAFGCAVALAVGTLVAGSAPTFAVFVTGRAIQGTGASGIFVIAIVLVLELVGPKRRGLAIGLVNTCYTIGVALGATLAGALFQVTGWRALFYIQAPIALLGGAALLFAIPQSVNSSKRDNSDSRPSTLTLVSRIDYLGAITLTSSIALLLYALSSVTKIPIWPIIASAVVLVAYILNELYLAVDPIVPIALLRSRGLFFTCLGTTGFMVGRWALLFYTPVWGLVMRNMSPAEAGSLLVPTNAAFAAGGIIVGWLHIRSSGSYYLSTLVVYTIFPITLLALAALSTPYGSVALVMVDVIVCGFATGAALNYVLAHLLHLTPQDTHYVATSLLGTFRGFGASFGSAVCGGVFSRALSTALKQGFDDAGLEGREDLMRQLLGSPALVRELKGVEHRVALKGYESALKTLFISAAVLAALMIVLQAGTGWKGAKNEKGEERREEEVAPEV